MNPQLSSSSAWKGNDSATNRVIQLLQDSGALAEARVSSICQEFVNRRNKKQGIRIQSDSLTYGLDSETSPLRQIDQRVSLYKEFPVNALGGAVLHLQIPIEVKHRKDLQLFGIPYPPHSYRPRMPMIGFLNGTEIFRTIARKAPFQNTALLHPVLLEIQNGATPQKVYGENIFYNAAGSIYDFIRFELTEEREVDELPYGSHVIDSMGVMTRFDRFLKKTNYAWWTVIHDWMHDTFTDELVKEYNRRFGARRIYQGIDLYCPVVCMDIPMWLFDGKTFHQLDSILTRVRVSHWPGSFRQKLAGYTTEAPLLITNLSGLPNLLDEAGRWFLEVEKLIKDAKREIKARWFIESTFYQMAVRKGLSEEPQSVRSDLDVFSNI